MLESYPDILSVEDVQKILRISRHLVYDLINQNKLPALKVGKAFRIPKSGLIAFVTQNTK